MATEREYQNLYDRIAALRETVTSRLASTRPEPAAGRCPHQADRRHARGSGRGRCAKRHPRRTRGLAELIGIGPEAADEFGKTRIPQGVEPYDETVTSERIMAVGDLYYIYQHERIGVFRVVQKLQELFQAGTVRLSAARAPSRSTSSTAARCLRYTRRDRLAAYRRVFGYGSAPVPPGSRPNTDFHPLFTPLHQPGHALLARQAGLRRHPRAGLRPQLRQHRDRPPRRAGPAQQPEVHLVRPP